MYPLFQPFFRNSQMPSLIIWRKHDSFFIPAGVETYRRDNPNAVVELLSTGHFALETHVLILLSIYVKLLAVKKFKVLLVISASYCLKT